MTDHLSTDVAAFLSEHRDCGELNTAVSVELRWPLEPRPASARHPLAQLEHLDGLARAGTPWGEDVRTEIRRRMDDWRAVLLRHPAEARQILRKLIAGRLTMTPKVTAEGRWYEITGQASYGALLAGVVGLVPPGSNAG